MVSFLLYDGGDGLPLIESVSFVAELQKQGRVQVPLLFRWKFKLEPGEVFYVDVKRRRVVSTCRFLARMRKDGRVTIPKVVLKLLRKDQDFGLDEVLEFTLAPVSKEKSLT